MTARYAIFYAPEDDSELAVFGKHWLREGSVYSQWTSSPRHYGLHGTLKPPMTLNNEGQPPTDPEALKHALQHFADLQQAFPMPTLEVATIGDSAPFIALRPIQDENMLAQLAADCVQAFDDFRAPLTAADYQKRPDDSLTEQQRVLRQQWGYPYVLEEFRFHLTLTNKISDRVVQQELLEKLREDFAKIQPPQMCKSLCLFSQPNRQTPFSQQQRFYFGDSR